MTKTMGINESKHYDICIVGGGLVGSALALALARLSLPDGSRSPLNIALLESRAAKVPSAKGVFDTRVLAINERSQNFLNPLLGGENFFELERSGRICPYTTMDVWDTEGSGHVHFDSAELHRDSLGHIVEQSVLMAALQAEINSTANIDYLCPGSLDAISREAGLSGPFELMVDTEISGLTTSRESLSCDLLIGADGSRSRVRDLQGFGYHQQDTGHTAIVATLKTGVPHNFCARQWFSSTGPLAFLPLLGVEGDQHHVSIVWSQLHERAEQLFSLPEEEFCRQLALASEQSVGSLELVGKRVKAPLKQAHTENYFQPGVALLGDAAHSIHPLAGQGVNLGFADARALADEIGRSLFRGLPINHCQVLQRYQRSRRMENRLTELAMEGFKALFEQQDLPLTLLRNQGMWVFNKAKSLKHLVIKRAMGVG